MTATNDIIKVSCPNAACRTTFQTAAENRGSMARCPKCNQEFVIGEEPRKSAVLQEAPIPPLPTVRGYLARVAGKMAVGFGIAAYAISVLTLLYGLGYDIYFVSNYGGTWLFFTNVAWTVGYSVFIFTWGLALHMLAGITWKTCS